jgi:hypothetical protein
MTRIEVTKTATAAAAAAEEIFFHLNLCVDFAAPAKWGKMMICVCWMMEFIFCR